MTKLSEIRLIYKIYRKNRPWFGTFCDFPLITSKNLQKISRASRAGITGTFRGGFIIYKNFLPRFARVFYYLQNLQTSARGG